ncbi:hypothetical protein DdX_13953 [Ditylenchus destructor]|uniref:BTB domain-containing protein n=1 Tax=Ditylenchus destructor TaxID=166010 RepID=A0AAD4MU85_9BILA|nr:hypothetical protein DdX_13953 [Ditylenchus destructor]
MEVTILEASLPIMAGRIGNAKKNRYRIFTEEFVGSYILANTLTLMEELFSWHSEYFKNIFNNKLFMESSQDSIDLIDFTYKQFRLLYKHIYVESVHLPGRYLHTDGAIRFRLISREGVRQSQKLWNLTEIQKYCQLHAGLLEQTNDASGKMLLKTNSCMGDDVRQLKAVLEIIRCISTEYVWKDGFQTVSGKSRFKMKI